jgi:multidrug efflux pump
MTVTLAAVYAPIGLQGGLTGSLFREFAFTLAGAVVISGIVALTLSPLMASRLLTPGREDKGLVGRINRGFDLTRRLYGKVLDATLSARPAVYTIWIGLSLLTVPMFLFAARELAPAEDQGVLFGIVEADANATIDQTTFYTEAENHVFTNLPEAEQTFQITSPDNAFGGVVLKPWNERKRTAAQLQPVVQMQVAKIPGIRTIVATPPALPGGGTFPVEFVIASTAEPETILEFAKQIQQIAATNGMFAFPPIIDTKVDEPEMEIELDRDKVASMGLDMATVGADLSTLTGGNYVNRFNLAGHSYKVIPQLERVQRLNAGQLQNIYVKGPNGQLVPLSTFATLKAKNTPRSLNRFQQFNAVTISGVAIRPLDQTLTMLETEAGKILPQGYKLDYTGESRQLRTEGNKFFPALALALIMIFLVLAVQFNSFRDPWIILLGSVPLAMFGAMIFIFLKMPNPMLPFWTTGWTTSFNIYSQVGLITLVGLVSKNGILIVEFANVLQRAGKTKIEAVREAALTRLRPVLMTSAATICGHFPLTLVTGAGAAARNSIGITIVSGMFLGTVFTLLVIPAIYVLIAKQHNHDDTEI